MSTAVSTLPTTTLDVSSLLHSPIEAGTDPSPSSDGTVIGFMIMGFFAATTYAWLLTRENAKKVAEQDRQDALHENEKRVYTVAELRDLGDK